MNKLTTITKYQLNQWIGISESKYYLWQKRLGEPNKHNGHIVRDAGLLNRLNKKKSKTKKRGFDQPGKPHQHRHMDIK
jgi:hypothetical protein